VPTTSQFLRIEPRRQCRGTCEIGEHDRELAAFGFVSLATCRSLTSLGHSTMSREILWFPRSSKKSKIPPRRCYTIYLNLNVVYEIGYAIGRGKRAYLVRHKETEGDRGLRNWWAFRHPRLLRIRELRRPAARLEAHIDTAHLNVSTALDRKSPVYIVEPPKRGTDVGVMVLRIKKAGYGRYRSFTPEEDTRLSATDAICQVAVSSGIFIPFQQTIEAGPEVHNIRCMFVAGLCDGMASRSCCCRLSASTLRSMLGMTLSSGTSSPTSTILSQTSARRSSSSPGRSNRQGLIAPPCSRH
jgi:hypothetical protein